MNEVGYGLEELLEFGKAINVQSGKFGAKGMSIWLARELLKVRDKEGEHRALVANTAQIRFESQRGRHNIVVKARQMGMTTWVAGRFFLKTITARGVLTAQVAHTRDAAEAIFRMVQRFWESLPGSMRNGCLRRSRANVGQMVFPELDSEFRVLSAADESAGRGLTLQNLHCSEVSRWPGDAMATLAGLRAALSPDGEMVIESTPNGAHGCFYEEWQQADERGTVQHFYPWWLEGGYVSTAATGLREDEISLMFKHSLSLRQVGFRRGLESSYRGLRVQEFAEDAELCFRSTGECCFDLEALELRLASVHEAVESRRNGALRIWLPPIAGKEYLVAVDTAGGGSDGDYAAVQVIELASGVQCAELQQRIGVLELARVAASLGHEYGRSRGQGAMIAVERNNHGSAVLAHLSMGEPYAWLYEQAGVAGWLTSASSKPGMISRLGALLVETPWLFMSRNLLEECRTFVSHPGGRTGAANGAHDDCLMAMALAHAVRAERLEAGSRRGRAG
jgi:uncharacterized small protein (DUF1192 family)